MFLEALERAGRDAVGRVLVIDNDGRLDEGCIGDLVALECASAGIAGIVIWGLHRDSAELRRMGLPVFSLGRAPRVLVARIHGRPMRSRSPISATSS